MSRIEAKTKKSSEFTCPNVSCGKVFTKPLRALNLQQDNREPYDACPYCLTEIARVINTEPPFAYDKPEPETFEPEETKTEVEEPKPMEEQVETPEATSECPHHFGYLSERSSKEQIPDECMMCKDIVTCMLKKMKG
jgi:hypothetical protein